MAAPDQDAGRERVRVVQMMEEVPGILHQPGTVVLVTDECPRCGGVGVPIAYGYLLDGPTQAQLRGEEVSGGCVRRPESCRCRLCGHEWVAPSP
jgi:hypothetical protein